VVENIFKRIGAIIMKDVLIINSDTEFFRNFAEYLGMFYGIENVVTTADKGSAVQILKTAPFDLVILDLGMSGADAVLDDLRRNHPKVPVMVMANEGMDTATSRFKDRNIRPFLHMPRDIHGMAQQILEA